MVVTTTILKHPDELPQMMRQVDLAASASNAVPLSYCHETKLSDGTGITIRPISSNDKDLVISFHSRLSEETRFLRYHYSKGPLTESDLKDLCEIDYSNTLALVAETFRNGGKEIIGIGQFIRLAFDHTAEVAFAVQDCDQNKGIGTHLLKHLSILAWPRGIYYFFGEVLRQNGKMLAVFRKSDPDMKQEIDSAVTCTVTISVYEAMHRIL